MPLGDLTSLARVQAYLSDGQSVAADKTGVLKSMITGVSGIVLRHLQRDMFGSLPYVDTFGGKDNRAHFMSEWPVTSVASVSINGVTIAASNGASSGYVFDAWNGRPPGQLQSVQLVGGRPFVRGALNCAVSYVAGYLVAGEVQTIPAGAPYQVVVDQPYGSWIGDNGVTYADGTPLVPVAANPAVGQYAVLDFATAQNPVGAYVFAAADATAGVKVSYSYVPSDVEQAVIALVGERYKKRTRIGMSSQSMGGQVTESYDKSDIPAYIRSDLLPYRKVLPV